MGFLLLWRAALEEVAALNQQWQFASPSEREEILEQIFSWRALLSELEIELRGGE
jgi:hypothetical protein